MLQQISSHVWWWLIIVRFTFSLSAQGMKDIVCFIQICKYVYSFYTRFCFSIISKLQTMAKKIYLIDGNSFIYRMFFGLPEFSTKDWKVVNAIFGMAKFFVKQLERENPDYLVFVKDAKGENFRHKIYKDYKATRDRMPDALRDQINDIEKMIQMMWVDIIDIPWYEADDVIATLAVQLWQDSNNEIYILSWDKDLYALITDNVKIYDTQKRKVFDIEGAKKKFWVEPEFVTDYLAIVWDVSDNIPGMAGFGPKKAEKLINQFGSIESIYKAFDDWEDLGFKWKTLEKFEAARETAFLSKKLATLETNADLSLCHSERDTNGDDCFDLSAYSFKPEFLLNEKVKAYFRELEFYSLLWEVEVKDLKTWKDTGRKVQIVGDNQWLEELTKKILNYDEIVLDTETTALDVFEAKLVGVSIYLDDDNIYYINRLHSWPQVSDDILKSFLQSLLDSDITIIWHNIKYDLQIMTLYLSGETYKDAPANDNFWQMWLGI